MSDEKDYTLGLGPKSKTRHSPGPFDIETRKPHYEIEISAPKHVKHQIEVRDFLMGNPGSYQWVYEINNKSSWPAFIIIKKDGEVVKFV